MARTDYVQIGRTDLEDWLKGLKWKWSRNTQRAGIYLIHFSPTVGVKLSSTIGSKNDAMAKGKASMGLALISLVTGQILNRKARDRKYFQRTKNWRITWLKGIEHWFGVYMKAQGFYDAIASITDRDQYRDDLLAKIEAEPHWQQDRLLVDFHQRVQGGGILTANQIALLDKTLAKAPEAPEGVEAPDTDRKLERLRDLYRVSRHRGDEWTMNFAHSIANQMKAKRTLSQRQNEMVVRKLSDYGLL